MRRTWPGRGTGIVAVALVLLGQLVSPAGSSAAAPAPPPAPVLGALTVDPPSGGDDEAASVTTSGGCQGRGTNYQVHILGKGWGDDSPGRTNGTNVTANVPQDPAATTITAPLLQTFANFAAMQKPPVTLSGTYELRLVCRSRLVNDDLGDFRATLTFTRAPSGTTTYTSAPPAGVPSSPPPPQAGQATALGPAAVRSPGASTGPSTTGTGTLLGGPVGSAPRSGSPSAPPAPPAPGAASGPSGAPAPAASPGAAASPAGSPSPPSAAPSEVGSGSAAAVPQQARSGSRATNPLAVVGYTVGGLLLLGALVTAALAVASGRARRRRHPSR